MNQILTLLIQDEIRLTRLVRTLEHLDVNAMSYLGNTSVVIFELLNLTSSRDQEILLDAYFKRIENASEDNSGDDSKYIESIVDWLEAIAKV